MNGKSNTMKS